jgi:2-oxoglutarate dehydrogenase E1 component
MQDRLERIRSKPNYTAEQKKRMLERLTAAETLERYLHTRTSARSASRSKAASP